MEADIHVRARRFKDRPLKFIYNAEFKAALADPGLRADIIGPMPHLEAFEAARRECVPPPDVTPETAYLYGEPLLTQDQEQHLFRKMNFLYYCANEQIEKIDLLKPRRELLTRIERLINEANEIKKLVAACNVRLAWEFARRTAENTRNEQINVVNLVSDANHSLMRAVEGFDYGRGFKFSTYAVWCIKKNFYKSVADELNHHSRWQTGNDIALDSKIDDNPHEYDVDREDQRQHVQETINEMLKCLTPRKRQILREYYGLNGQKRTLVQIGRLFKVSKERVRQLRNQGRRKLQELAAEKNLTLSDILCGSSL